MFSDQIKMQSVQSVAMKSRRRQLYLVDDGPGGWSIREVDLSSDSDFGNSPVSLPLPPVVVTFVAPPGVPYQFTSAFGTMIMASRPRFRYQIYLSTATFIFDVSLSLSGDRSLLLKIRLQLNYSYLMYR